MFKSKEEILKDKVEGQIHVAGIYSEAFPESWRTKCEKCKCDVALGDKELLRKDSVVLCTKCALEDIRKLENNNKEFEIVVWDKNKELAETAFTIMEFEKIKKKLDSVAG